MSRVMWGLLLVAGGCSLGATLPEGRIRCEAPSDCPSQWSCRRPGAGEAGLCYRTPGDAGALDSGAANGAMDAAQAEGGSPRDAMIADTGVRDSGRSLADAAHDASSPPPDGAMLTDGAAQPEAGVDAGSSQAPTVTAVVLGKRRAIQGTDVSATCLGSDPDGDTLSYAWSAGGGSFVDDSAKNTSYTADDLGPQELVCTLDDGHGGTDQGSQSLRVYPTGLVALYPFSLDSQDQSGNQHHGTVTGGVYGSDRAGNSGTAMQLDGSSSNVTLADPSAFDLPGFSFVATIQPAAANHGRTIVSKGATGFGAFTVLLYADDDASVPRRLSVSQDSAMGAPYAVVLSDYQVMNGTFFQLAVTRSDAGALRVYADGVLIHSSNGMPAAPLNTEPVVLGNGPLGGFAGVLDEVQIYDRALTASEVQALTGMQ